MVTSLEKNTVDILIADLTTLVDLLSVHFVEGTHEDLQQKAIELTNHLIQDLDYTATGGVVGLHQLFNFLQQLKQANLETRDGYCWTELMRKHLQDLWHHYGEFTSKYKKHYIQQRVIGNQSFAFKHLSFEQRKRYGMMSLDLF